jgi:hypothetical protein
VAIYNYYAFVHKHHYFIKLGLGNKFLKEHAFAQGIFPRQNYYEHMASRIHISRVY